MLFSSYLNSRILSMRNLKFSLIDLIVLASYYLFCLLLLLSLTGLFKKEFIALGLAAGFLVFSVFFWKRIEYKKRYLYFFIFIPFIFTGILLTEGAFDGDAIRFWLPLAREITLQSTMPDFLLNTSDWLTTRMPLMPLFQAGLFSFFGFSNWLIVILPFFFASASVFLVYQWLLEKGVKRDYLILGVLALITNAIFLRVGHQPIQEPFILFFSIALFYYLEKIPAPSERGSPRLSSGRQKYFLLAFLSAVLAAVSKETGVFLFLPLLFILIKNRQLKKSYFYLFLTFPLLLWLIRNYIIYGNPVFSYLNGIFKGPYYDLALTLNQLARNLDAPPWGNNIALGAVLILLNLFLLFSPLVILSFYGFFKERKIYPVTHNLPGPSHFIPTLSMSNGVHYILLFLVFFLIFMNIFPISVRYYLPFLGVFIVYAMVGLEKVNSKIFLSFIFFLNLWGLFSTKLPSLSQSQFIAPLESMLSNLGNISQFVYDYRLIAAIALGLFFFFFLCQRTQAAKYLILLSVFTYLVKTQSFNLGSWLNLWLPILALILIILAWRLIGEIKEGRLLKLIVGYAIILLLLNSWGMALTYFLTHRQFVFPNFEEAYGAQPEAAFQIEKLEEENRDFYIYAAAATYFTWYENLKVVELRSYNFHNITDLEYSDDLNPSEIHALFKKSNIRYVVKNRSRAHLEQFFDKIKSRPDLFEPILQKEGVYLWRIK